MEAHIPTDPRLDRLRAVYTDVHPRLWRALLAWSGSTQVADEATAEAFVQVARRGDAARDPAAWVWRAGFRIAAGEMAARRREADRTVPLGDMDAPAPAPPEVLDLLDALARLTDQQRRAVVLTDGAGFSSAEAATLMGTSATQVRVQASRARRHLRTLLAYDQEADRA